MKFAEYPDKKYDVVIDDQVGSYRAIIKLIEYEQQGRLRKRFEATGRSWIEPFDMREGHRDFKELKARLRRRIRSSNASEMRMKERFELAAKFSIALDAEE